MPKKKESQPVQIWLNAFDRRRLSHLSSATRRSQSDLGREAIRTMLDASEKQLIDKEKNARLYRGLTSAAKSAIVFAEQEAINIDKDVVGTEHLLLAIAADTTHGAGRLLANAGVPYKLARSKVEVFGWPDRKPSAEQPPYTDRFLTVIDRARKIAKHLRDKWVDLDHLLLSLLEQASGTGYEILEVISIDREALRAAVRKDRSKRKQITRRKSGQ